ncbi:ThuA domain-containing protein [Micromonospora sp. NBC_00421]|uniref:ThuA domain-containing protein n=1 Tax=Micromonospora sp. NBC_00421 TaxID=2975976 RepID=UPI002E2323C1
MRLFRPILGAAAAVLAAIACTTPATPASAADAAYDVLVFSKTAGFRHDSIAVGTQAIRELGAANNFTVTATEDGNQFTTANLSRFEAVIFLNTTGDVLNASQQTAFESYIGAGGGYVGVHSAADTEYDWPFYGNLVGAWFASHPAIQQATVRVEDRAHAATAHLGPTWQRTDEWYNFRTNARSTAHVLANLDESSYSGGGMGADHPHVWCKTYSGGRSFYTGAGHNQSAYSEPAFRAHLLGGIRYAAGRTKADCRPETGYTALYNGSTNGWSQAGPGSFTNSNATLSSVGGLGMLWYSAKQFTNYSLKLDWKVDGDDNSGVLIGFPPSSDPNSAMDNGYEVQIDATDTVDRTTGSVYSFQAADQAARDAALNPPGEWNTYELLVEGERLQVFLNGSKINDFTNTNPVRSLAGHIGIQNHGTGDDASFRNIRIKELGGTTPTNGTGPIKGLGGKCLDVRNGATADGTQIQIFTCNGSARQTWTVTPNGPIKALGKCLDVSGGGTANGTKIQLWTCTGGTPQVWSAQSDGTLRNPASGKCLDVSGNSSADSTVVLLWTCNSSAANQKWTLPQ